jgi:hypothetical protein
VLLREFDFKVSPLMVADSHVTVVRLPKTLSPFLFHYISCPVIQQNMGDMVSGSTKTSGIKHYYHKAIAFSDSSLGRAVSYIGQAVCT